MSKTMQKRLFLLIGTAVVMIVSFIIGQVFLILNFLIPIVITAILTSHLFGTPKEKGITFLWVTAVTTILPLAYAVFCVRDDVVAQVAIVLFTFVGNTLPASIYTLLFFLVKAKQQRTQEIE